MLHIYYCIYHAPRPEMSCLVGIRGNKELTTTVIAFPLKNISRTAYITANNASSVSSSTLDQDIQCHKELSQPPPLPKLPSSTSHRRKDIISASTNTAFVTGTGVPVRPVSGIYKSLRNTTLSSTSCATTAPAHTSPSVLLKSADSFFSGTQILPRTYPYTYICRNNVTAYMHVLQLLLNKATTLSLPSSNFTCHKTNSDFPDQLFQIGTLIGTPLYQAFKKSYQTNTQVQQSNYCIMKVHVKGVNVKTIVTFYRNVLRLLVISPQRPFVVSTNKQSFGTIGNFTFIDVDINFVITLYVITRRGSRAVCSGRRRW